ncbi:MAG: carboxypeptidase regulatory-like domain-containing protein [Saprospiraceae bacterium]|nr:carboxypeptidase regulatory-like domain-containing protein [Saprospiraceae bacterium]
MCQQCECGITGECNVPCANSPISISGPVCETNGAGTYRIHYIVNPGTVVTASAGTLTATSVTGIPSGTDLILTITTPGCSTRVVTVPAATCQLGNATIGNFVWHDQNGDGQQGSSEPGIGGVTVMLLDPLGNMIAQTTTASNGAYTISGIPPGTYYLKFSIPSGFQPTFALIGNPASDSDLTGTFGAGTTNLFTLAPGQVNNSLDAGFFRCALIGERVWYDTNRNDIQDNPENGINGLRVNLWRNHFGVWTIWDFTFTGHKPNTPSEDGWWQFCAPPGQYYVQIIIPPLGLVQVQPNRGNNPNRDSDLTNAFGQGTTNSFTVSSGGSKLDLAGGYYPMAIAGNLVWNDLNMNGIQDLNEPKVSGVKVEDLTQKITRSSENL